MKARLQRCDVILLPSVGPRQDLRAKFAQTRSSRGRGSASASERSGDSCSVTRTTLKSVCIASAAKRRFLHSLGPVCVGRTELGFGRAIRCAGAALPHCTHPRSSHFQLRLCCSRRNREQTVPTTPTGSALARNRGLFGCNGPHLRSLGLFITRDNTNVNVSFPVRGAADRRLCDQRGLGKKP
jgi:hypothetical protein